MDALLPPRVDPQSLFSAQAQRDAVRIRAFNAVLASVYAKMRSVARVPGTPRKLVYVIQDVMVGVPRFNVEECAQYAIVNLTAAGYVAEFTPPNLLYVSWEAHEEKYYAELSPMAQVLKRVAAAPTSGGSSSSGSVRGNASTTAPAWLRAPPALPPPPQPAAFTAPLVTAPSSVHAGTASSSGTLSAARPIGGGPAPRAPPRTLFMRTDQYVTGARRGLFSIAPPAPRGGSFV